jgi:hypothetical protein
LGSLSFAELRTPRLAEISRPRAGHCDTRDEIAHGATGDIDQAPPLLEVEEQLPPPLGTAVLPDEHPLDRAIRAHSSILNGQVESCTQRRHRPVLRGFR